MPSATLPLIERERSYTISRSSALRVHVDFETRSKADIKKVGGSAYAAHQSTEIICLGFKIGSDATQLVTLNDLIEFNKARTPLTAKMLYIAQLKTAAHREDVVFVAHNAIFEYEIWNRLMVPLGFPRIEAERWRCTMAKAYAFGLPGSLEDVGNYLQLNTRKDAQGKALIKLLCMPKTKGGDDFWTPEEKPHEFQDFYRYCVQDVYTEYEVDKTLPDLPPMEQRVWELDLRMNTSGIAVDMPMVIKANEFIAQHNAAIKAEMKAVTKGRVESPTKRGDLKKWLGEKGLEVEDTRKATLRSYLDERDSLPEDVVEALLLTAEGTKSSLAKYKKILERSEGGIIKGVMQYHGAHTGRWAGRGIQIQNLPRPGFDLNMAVEHLMMFEYDQFKLWHGDVAQALSWMLRGAIIARPGRKLYCADFSQMESRFLAWLAGQESKLELFRSGVDLYCSIASQIYGREIDKKRDPDERQVGKVADLALGYQGGINAFIQMSKGYGVDLLPIAPDVCRSATQRELESAIWTYENNYAKRGGEAPKLIAVAVDIIKQRWRANHPFIVELWEKLQQSAIDAVVTKQPVECGRLLFFMHKQFLCVRLPSGRTIKYPYPKVRYDAKGNASLSYLSARGWRTQYGGKWAENIVQAGQRDLLSEAMVRLDDAGYPPLFLVHDEEISEVLESFGSLDEFKRIMSQSPVWAGGLPIAVSGWEGYRYGKG
jgi:DNA polymerase